jgi:hypothetical protein
VDIWGEGVHVHSCWLCPFSQGMIPNTTYIYDVCICLPSYLWQLLTISYFLNSKFIFLSQKWFFMVFSLVIHACVRVCFSLKQIHINTYIYIYIYIYMALCIYIYRPMEWCALAVSRQELR